MVSNDIHIEEIVHFILNLFYILYPLLLGGAYIYNIPGESYNLGCLVVVGVDVHEVELGRGHQEGQAPGHQQEHAHAAPRAHAETLIETVCFGLFGIFSGKFSVFCHSSLVS